MEIYNADGSQVEMCGNGIRCFAKYVYDHGITQKIELAVETLAGIIRPKIVGDLVEVDMGETSCKVPLAQDMIAKIESMGRVGAKRKTMKC